MLSTIGPYGVAGLGLYTRAGHVSGIDASYNAQLNVVSSSLRSALNDVQDVVTLSSTYGRTLQTVTSSPDVAASCCTPKSCEVTQVGHATNAVCSDDSCSTVNTVNKGGFASVLRSFFRDGFHTLRKAGHAVANMLQDENANFAEIAAAVNEAEQALSQMISVRNELVSALQKIISMPL